MESKKLQTIEGFTPGPWRPNNAVIETKDGIALQVAIAAPADRVGMAPRSRSEQLANARLIAAAPELYQALKDIVFFGTVQGQRLANAKAAISKAEGDHNA